MRRWTSRMLLASLLIVGNLNHALGEDDPIDLHYNIIYSQVKHGSLDLAIPQTPDGLRPGVVVIHGGGWVEGDKASFATAEHGVPGNIVEFAQLGFVAATINYRLSGDAPFPPPWTIAATPSAFCASTRKNTGSIQHGSACTATRPAGI